MVAMMTIVIALAATGQFLSTAVAAERPVALVESVTGRVTGAEFMDYVAAGNVIKLGPTGAIVLGYLGSCWHETITGGTVVIGEEKSTVSEGKLQRVKVECDSAQTQVSEQVRRGAGTVLRGGGQAVPQPQLTIYGLSPVVEVGAGGPLIIERLDKPRERYEIPPSSTSLLRGRFYDFAKSGKSLAPDGIYVARLGAREIVFKVDPRAKPGEAPMVGRLVRFN